MIHYYSSRLYLLMFILDHSKIWTDEATKMLIELYKRYEKQFENGIKKYAWKKIATEMTNRMCQTYSAQQCDTKFKLLKNMYKQVKYHNEQSGNNRKNWKFFDMMHEILYSRPEITPKATCSSESGLIIQDRPSNTVENVTSGKLIPL